MTIMNRSKMNLPREYFLGLRLRVIVIPFKRMVVFGAVSEKPREPLVILSEPLVILSETLLILSEPCPRFLARLPGELRPKGAEPAIVVQPPLELSDLVLRFE